MKTNELKKGVRIQLRNGWQAIVKDNAKGNTRMCEVFGHFTEIGSVYSHDIMKAEINDQWIDIEHTDAQKKLREKVKALGF
jgi:hypothetical protein